MPALFSGLRARAMASRTYVDDILEAVVFAPGWTFFDMRGLGPDPRWYNQARQHIRAGLTQQSYHRGCAAGLSASLEFEGPTLISWIAPTASDSGVVRAFIDDSPSASTVSLPS